MEMNKAELVASVLDKVHDGDFTSKVACERAVNAVFASITEALLAGDRVTVTGFGAFDVVKRAARKGRVVSTGEPLHIPEHKVVKFSMGKQLKEAVR